LIVKLQSIDINFIKTSLIASFRVYNLSFRILICLWFMINEIILFKILVDH